MSAPIRAIFTRLVAEEPPRLESGLIERPARALREGEALVRMIAVPVHGSFWLASHPRILHPRAQEFLRDGGFVFGNGGVGRVIAADAGAPARPGDTVAIHGHLPCRHAGCHACGVLERFTECDHGEGSIIGHGAGAPDGTFAEFAILPASTYEVCATADRPIGDDDALPYMYAFLMADVRNALTRLPDTLARDRVLLIGAGQSGLIAAWLLSRANPDLRMVVVDSSAERAARLRSLRPEAIDCHVPPPHLSERLNRNEDGEPSRSDLDAAVADLVSAMRRRFGGRVCNLVVDASSGNTAPLWADARVLAPGGQAIVFGFGSRELRLDRAVVQRSGLTLLMSRGVGPSANRREVVRLIADGGAAFARGYLMEGARRLSGLDDALAFIRSQQTPPRMLHEIPQAYLVPHGDAAR